MTTYDGPATATADGAEYDVTAHLAITAEGHLQVWHGSLTAQTESDAAAIWEASTTTLHTGSSGEGDFMKRHWNAGSTELTIRGSGPAPFGS
ncbi:hypothetical protein [Streptomyces sp. NPDC000888]